MPALTLSGFRDSPSDARQFLHRNKQFVRNPFDLYGDHLIAIVGLALKHHLSLQDMAAVHIPEEVTRFRNEHVANLELDGSIHKGVSVVTAHRRLISLFSGYH